MRRLSAIGRRTRQCCACRSRADPPAAASPSRVHFVGIGGAGLSPLASLAIHRGQQVSGSDMRLSDTVARLRDAGAVVSVGHSASNLDSGRLPDAVVVSSAVSGDNAEIEEARRVGVPIYTRGAWLSRVTAEEGTEAVIAIAGTHGKTTTSALLALALDAALGLGGEADSGTTAIVGGDVPQFGPSGGGCKRGGTRFCVIEADEYQRTFLALRFTTAVLTNVEVDHVDAFADARDVHEAFASFARGPSTGARPGALVVCGDDPGCRAVIRALREAGADQPAPHPPRPCRRVVTYGFGRSCEWRAERLRPLPGGGTAFDVRWRAARLGRLSLRLGGEHNVLNALAAVAACHTIRAPLPHGALAFPKGVLSRVRPALAAFLGVARRAELLGSARLSPPSPSSSPSSLSRGVGASTVVVMSDYAHHPTEVRTTLRAVRRAKGGGGRRVVALFEPHTLSRLRHFADDFATAFSHEGGECDAVFVASVFEPGGGGKVRKEGRDGSGRDVAAQDVAARIARAGGLPCACVPDEGELVRCVAEDLVGYANGGGDGREHGHGQVLVALGAGRADAIARRILSALRSAASSE